MKNQLCKGHEGDENTLCTISMYKSTVLELLQLYCTLSHDSCSVPL